MIGSLDYWVKRDGEEHIVHEGRIGSGGYGEVHKVLHTIRF
jgi:hypothetical protein